MSNDKIIGVRIDEVMLAEIDKRTDKETGRSSVVRTLLRLALGIVPPPLVAPLDDVVDEKREIDTSVPENPGRRDDVETWFKS